MPEGCPSRPVKGGIEFHRSMWLRCRRSVSLPHSVALSSRRDDGCMMSEPIEQRSGELLVARVTHSANGRFVVMMDAAPLGSGKTILEFTEVSYVADRRRNSQWRGIDVDSTAPLRSAGARAPDRSQPTNSAQSIALVDAMHPRVVGLVIMERVARLFTSRARTDVEHLLRIRQSNR